MQFYKNETRQYGHGQLTEDSVERNPFSQFEKWFSDAEGDGIPERTAMNLSTVGDDGTPLSRMVLLKGFSDKGFVFFTNYLSRKARHMDQNPSVCLSFYWKETDRQVIIKGMAHRLADAESDLYFSTRPFESQISAIASPQSKIIESREYLEELCSSTKKKYSEKNISRPSYWGGYLVIPSSFEFWQGRVNRLHDRILYEKGSNDKWHIHRLAP